MNATNPKDVVEHFGSVVNAQGALNLKSRQSVYYWLKMGKVPELRARQIADVTGGALRFDPKAYE